MESIAILLDAAQADDVLIDLDGDTINLVATPHKKAKWVPRLKPHADAIRRHMMGIPAEEPPESVSEGDRNSTPKTLDIVTLSMMLETHPEMRPPVIDGLLRQGETMNVIAAPKVGKSWLAHGLAAAISDGSDWLGYQVVRGRVLIIDVELHRETAADRLRKVTQLGGDPTMIDVVCLRGQQCDILRLVGEAKRDIAHGTYGLIILDALYRLLPDGTAESDNAKMMHVYNSVDTLAQATGAAVAIVHHTSKGNQSDKGITDVGSGAGSISRAADTHVVLREHAIDNCVVLEAVTRSFKRPMAQTIRFDFPLWVATQIEPEVKGRRSEAAKQREATDDETQHAILANLSESRLISIARLRTRTGFGDSRVRRGIRLLGESVIAKRLKSKQKKGAYVDAFKLSPPKEAF